MLQPWFAGSADSRASAGGSGPEPVVHPDTNWTWDVEFAPASIHARTSINGFCNIGGGTGWLLSGIVAYSTRNSDGSDTLNLIGHGNAGGIADFRGDSNIDSVTFGWTTEGDNCCEDNINMEIWS